METWLARTFIVIGVSRVREALIAPSAARMWP